MKNVFVTNHDRWHAEIHHLVDQANEAQGEFRFQRVRPSDAEKEAIGRSPLDGTEAFEVGRSLQAAHQLGPEDALIVVTESNLRDREDDEYFFLSSPAGRMAIVSSYHLDPRSTFMAEGRAWWESATETERHRIASGSLLVSLLGGATAFLTGLGCHDATRGCIMDYCESPTDIEVALRGGLSFCTEECRPTLELRSEGKAMLRVAEALRRNPMRRSRLPTDDFDVFVSYHRADRADVRGVVKKLQDRGVRTWVDVEQLRPGMRWQHELQQQIERVHSAAVFVGTEGVGPWQELEVEAFLGEFVSRGCPVIPTLLPNAKSEPKLPVFLRGHTWVDFRNPDPDPMEQLIWGITGETKV